MPWPAPEPLDSTSERGASGRRGYRDLARRLLTGGRVLAVTLVAFEALHRHHHHLPVIAAARLGDLAVAAPGRCSSTVLLASLIGIVVTRWLWPTACRSEGRC